MPTISIARPRIIRLLLARPAARVRVRARRSRRAGPQAVGAGAGQLRRSSREGPARGARPSELLVDWDDGRVRGSRARRRSRRSRSPTTTRARSTSRCQPAVEFSGRVQDWVEEIRRGRERGDTMVLVAHSAGRAERTIELLADYEIFAVPMERAEDAHAAAVLVGVGHLSRGFRLPDAQLQLWAETDVFEEERKVHERRKSATRTFLSDFRDLKAGDLVVHVDHGIGLLRRPQADRRRPRSAGVHGAPLRRRRQALRPGRAARPRPEVHRRRAPGARPARRHDVGEGQDARQEGDARHGRGAAQALRRAQGRPGPRLQRRHPLAAGVRGRLRVGADAGSAHRRSPTSRATWSRRRRWTGCSAATSATARPKSRCAPRSRRRWTASRSRSSRRRPCSRSSTSRR